MTGRFVLLSVKALVRVTLSDSFRIRPPSIYRAPGIARPPTQMGGLGGSEIQSFNPIRSPGGYKWASVQVTKYCPNGILI